MCIRDRPWGTGQAVLACRNVIHEPFCVLNADDYYGAEAFAKIHDALDRPAGGAGALELCMAGYVPVSYTHLDVYKRQGKGAPT